MKRTITALLLTLLLLTGCGGSDSAGADRAPSQGAAANGAYENYDYGWVTEDAISGNAYASKGETPEAPQTESMDSTSGTGLQNVKLIYTADMNLQTKEYDAAAAAINALVAELGGYFETRELNQGGNYRSMYCVVRVPAAQFTPFLERAGGIANVTYRNEYVKDVSEAYYDLEARLTTQRTKLTRLQELLAQAEDMEDIITIESAISDAELQIEYLTGSLRHYDSLVGFSTINLSLNEVYRLSTEEETPLTFGDRLSGAFRRGFERGISDLEDFVISVARNWMGIIIWSVIIIVAVVLIRKRAAKRREIRGSVPGFLKGKAAEKADDTTDET